MNMGRPFWVLLALAWVVFALMAAGEFALKASGQPFGILDHQSAGTAARAAQIQQSWAESGRLVLAQCLVALDFIFIALSALACSLGGWSLIRQGVRALGGVALIGASAAFATDLLETANQALQLFGSAPSDAQAGQAKAMVEPKLTAYVVGNGALCAGLVLRRLKS